LSAPLENEAIAPRQVLVNVATLVDFRRLAAWRTVRLGPGLRGCAGPVVEFVLDGEQVLIGAEVQSGCGAGGELPGISQARAGVGPLADCTTAGTR